MNVEELKMIIDKRASNDFDEFIALYNKQVGDDEELAYDFNCSPNDDVFIKKIADIYIEALGDNSNAIIHNAIDKMIQEHIIKSYNEETMKKIRNNSVAGLFNRLVPYYTPLSKSSAVKLPDKYDAGKADRICKVIFRRYLNKNPDFDYWASDVWTNETYIKEVCRPMGLSSLDITNAVKIKTPKGKPTGYPSGQDEWRAKHGGI